HRGSLRSGDGAYDELLAYSQEHTFIIDIYDIEPDKIYFWANLPGADVLYQDLNAEFTDLEGLIKKMASEKLSGYIIVSLGQGLEKGYILFQNGKMLPQICYFNGNELLCLRDGPDRLIQQSREAGGAFHVKQVAPQGKKSATEQSGHTIEMLEELLSNFETVVTSQRKFRNKFETFLKKKFLDKSERFECIDPFLSDFTYENGKIQYTGDSPLNELAKGVCESVAELAQDLELEKQTVSRLRPWANKYKYTVRALGLPWFKKIDSVNP
ncbi:MAG: hypothetical protein ACOC0U_02735, partial [Desulfovibrionales bacterium]